MKTPLNARIRKCAACGQSKPITEYAHASHKRCSACYDFTGGGKASHQYEASKIAAMLRRKVDMPVRNSTSSEIYTAPELRPFDGRQGAMDAFKHPSRIGSKLVYRDGRRDPA